MDKLDWFFYCTILSEGCGDSGWHIGEDWEDSGDSFNFYFKFDCNFLDLWAD